MTRPVKARAERTPNVDHRGRRLDPRVQRRTTHRCGACGDRITPDGQGDAACTCGASVFRGGRVHLTAPKKDSDPAPVDPPVDRGPPGEPPERGGG